MRSNDFHVALGMPCFYRDTLQVGAAAAKSATFRYERYAVVQETERGVLRPENAELSHARGPIGSKLL